MNKSKRGYGLFLPDDSCNRNTSPGIARQWDEPDGSTVKLYKDGQVKVKRPGGQLLFFPDSGAYRAFGDSSQGDLTDT